MQNITVQRIQCCFSLHLKQVYNKLTECTKCKKFMKYNKLFQWNVSKKYLFFIFKNINCRILYYLNFKLKTCTVNAQNTIIYTKCM